MSEVRPLVSIITPTYNRVDYLPETIESVLSQDYSPIEYLIIDDGSTDNTQVVVSTYGDRIRYAYHENIGEAATVNRGFQLATGEIIGVMSSDDLYRPRAISTMVQALLDDPEVVVVYPDIDLIDEHGDVIRHVPSLEFSSYVDMVRWSHTFPGAGVLFRRSVVEWTGGRDPSIRFPSDFDFWMRAGLLGPFRRVPETLATWRVHQTSQSVEHRGIQMALELVKCMENLYARDDLPPEVRAVKMEAFRNVLIAAGITCHRGPWADSERFHILDSLSARIQGMDSQSLPATVIALHREVAQRDKTVRWLHDEVAQRDKTVRWLHDEAAQRDQTIRRLHEEVAERDQTLKWLHGEVAQRDQMVKWLHDEVAQRDTTIAELRGRTGELAVRGEQLNAEGARLPAAAAHQASLAQVPASEGEAEPPASCES